MRVHLWSENLALGIPEVDEQHKTILVALRELQLGLYNQLSVDEIAEKLVKIDEYREEHFATEEGLMLPYKDRLRTYEAHIRAHKDFSASVEKFFERFADEGVDMAEELFDALGTWLSNHINGLDREMSEELKALGAPYFKKDENV